MEEISKVATTPSVEEKLEAIIMGARAILEKSSFVDALARSSTNAGS